MRLDGLEHPKTLELAARLGVSRPTVIGHLELLWAFVSKLAPQGNLGKYPDGAIARAAEWQGDPTAFVDALLLTRFVDECGTNRLLVHDWADHCPSWVRAKLKKARLDFATRNPSIERSRVATIVPTIEGHLSTLSGDSARARVPSEAKRSEAYPRLGTIDGTAVGPGPTPAPPPAPTRQPQEWVNGGILPPTLGPGADGPTDDDLQNAFALIRGTFPKKAGRAHNWLLGERAWRKLVDDGIGIGTLQDSVARYADFVKGGGVSSTSYVLGVDQFFGAHDSPWQQPWELPEQLRSGSGRKTMDDYKQGRGGSGEGVDL